MSDILKFVVWKFYTVLRVNELCEALNFHDIATCWRQTIRGAFIDEFFEKSQVIAEIAREIKESHDRQGKHGWMYSNDR